MRFSTGAILILLYPVFIFGQSGDYRMGGRAMGMGYATGTLSGPWSGMDNIGALAGSSPRTSVGFACQSLYSLKGLGKKAAVINLAHRNLCSTVNFFKLGDDHYSLTKIGLGLGNKIRFVSLGLQLNYLQLSVEQAGTSGVFSLDAGGVAEMFPHLKVGAGIQNINRAKISRLTGESYPVVMQLTLSYLPQDFLILSIEVGKNSLTGMTFHSGMECAIHKVLYLRTGISTNPVKNYFGIGFRPRLFIIDYAVSIQNYLGFNHQVSLGILLNRKKNEK